MWLAVSENCILAKPGWCVFKRKQSKADQTICHLNKTLRCCLFYCSQPHTFPGDIHCTPYTMAEYWQSTKKFMCKACKVWVHDNVAARTHHDQTPRHKENTQLYLEKQQGAAAQKKREADEVQRELDRMNRAAGIATGLHDAGSTKSTYEYGATVLSSHTPGSSADAHFQALDARMAKEDASGGKQNEKPAGPPREATQAPSGLNRKERRALEKAGAGGVFTLPAPPSAAEAAALAKTADESKSKSQADSAPKPQDGGKKLSVAELLQLKKQADENKAAAAARGNSGTAGTGAEGEAAPEVGFGEWEAEAPVDDDASESDDSDVVQRRQERAAERARKERLRGLDKDAVSAALDSTARTLRGGGEVGDGEPDVFQAAADVSFRSKKRKASEVAALKDGGDGAADARDEFDAGDAPSASVLSTASTVVRITKTTASGKQRNFRRRVG